MSRNTLKTLSIILLLGLHQNIFCQDSKDYVIKNVEYSSMLDGYCAMTALQMNLNYYGIKVDQSLLLNLGWNYGFGYFSNSEHTEAWPNTNPIPEIVIACDLLGFKTNVKTHNSLEEARRSLVYYIAHDTPVIVQWVPHTILAYGYRDSASIVIYNDPGNYKNSLIAEIDNYSFSQGDNVKMPISNWERPPFLWGIRKYEMVIIEPEDRKNKINWKEIWVRNAEKTLGVSYESGFSTGIEGINAMIDDLNISINEDVSKSIELVKSFELCCWLGVGFRRDAATFLAGQSSTLNDQNLCLASDEFLKSANYFRKGENLIKWINNNSDQEKNIIALKEFVKILEDIVECERNGAIYLIKASK